MEDKNTSTTRSNSKITSSTSSINERYSGKSTQAALTSSQPPTPKSFSKSPAIDQAIAGFMAGAISTTILHPLDLLKVRLQVMEANSLTQTQTLSRLVPQVYKKEGLWKGLYRGLSANFAGSTLSWGLYFFYYSSIKEQMASQHSTPSTYSSNEPKQLSALQHLSASAVAGLLTSLVANPLFVVKTRMFTQSPSDPDRYMGLFGKSPILVHSFLT